MVDWTLGFQDREDSGDLEYIDPAGTIIESRGDVLRLTFKDDRSYIKVHAVRAFPLTEQDEFIGLLDAVSGREIGMLRDLRQLDSPTRKLVEDALDRTYFVPKIHHINQAKREFGTVYWDVETDRGRRQFVMRGIRDSIHEIETGRYLVVDIDGNRFEIPKLASLDSKSMRCWDNLI